MEVNMKAAFFFDTVLLEDDNNNFWGMTLTYEFIKDRYLKYFEEIIIATRKKARAQEKGNYQGYKRTEGKNVLVEPITQYNNVLDAIKNRKKIEKQIDKIVDNADFIIARMPSVIGMFACDSAKRHKKQYVIEMVACPLDGYANHSKKTGKILAPIMYYLNKKYIKEAPKVLYVTDEFLQRRYPTKGEKIACSDVELPNTEETILVKRKKKIEEGTYNQILRLATVASVELKYKGQMYVFKAIAKLKTEGKNVEYYLAGGGDNSRLKKYANKYKVQDNVIFLGSLTHEEVFQLMDTIDIYIQPSLQEGLPRALIEAMSRACPAIGTNAGGIPELLDERCIVKKKDVRAIYKILKNVTKDQLIKQAEKNYAHSKQFEKEKLEKKRELFYKGR